MKVIYLLVILAGSVLAPSLVRAQDKADPAPKPIIFDVTVQDKKHSHVSGLKKENFNIIDGNEEKTLSLFSIGEAATVGILVDFSGSMPAARLAAATDELTLFVAQDPLSNEYFTLVFGESFHLLTDLTTDRLAVTAGLTQIKSYKPKGNTKFLDALKVGLEKLDGGQHRKKVLLILTDGQDNQSKTKFNQIKWLIRESNVVLYFVNMEDRTDAYRVFPPEALHRMNEMAGVSGGAVFYGENIGELRDILKRISLDLQHQYTVGFHSSPSSKKDRDEWRKVKVRVETTNKEFDKKLRVVAREGYYASRKSH